MPLQHLLKSAGELPLRHLMRVVAGGGDPSHHPAAPTAAVARDEATGKGGTHGGTGGRQDRAGHGDVDAGVFALDHDVAGQAAQAQLGGQRPQNPGEDQDHPQNDQETCHGLPFS